MIRITFFLFLFLNVN